jgi:hypothetical protein
VFDAIVVHDGELGPLVDRLVAAVELRSREILAARLGLGVRSIVSVKSSGRRCRAGSRYMPPPMPGRIVKKLLVGVGGLAAFFTAIWLIGGDGYSNGSSSPLIKPTIRHRGQSPHPRRPGAAGFVHRTRIDDPVHQLRLVAICSSPALLRVI